eukprot:147402-Prymnesium_polylepis.1
MAWRCGLAKHAGARAAGWRQQSVSAGGLTVSTPRESAAQHTGTHAKSPRLPRSVFPLRFMYYEPASRVLRC